jgi:diacylglycerol kinase family enzyme
MNDPIRQIYVILNPIAGHSDVDDVRQAVEDLCNRQNWEFEIYETTGEENVADVARKATAWRAP